MKLSLRRVIPATLLVAVMMMLTCQPAFAFSSNSNAFLGTSPNECTGMGGQTEILFSATMSTTGSGSNQWSTQMNGYTSTNSQKLDWLQYNMAVDKSGDVYGSAEYWFTPPPGGPGGDAFNLNTGTLTTVTSVSANDYFLISTSVNSANNVSSVTYSYYNAKLSKVYTGSITIPSKYLVPLLSWQLNIVGENNQNDEYATFTSGAGTMYYTSSSGSGQLAWMSNQPTCTTVQGTITGETGTMYYATPSSSPAYEIDQSFQRYWKLTMTVSPSGYGTVSPATGYVQPGSGVRITATPNTGYKFCSWAGTGTGSYSGTSNPASVTMSSDIGETGIFAQTGHTCPNVAG